MADKKMLILDFALFSPFLTQCADRIQDESAANRCVPKVESPQRRDFEDTAIHQPPSLIERGT